MQAPKHSLEKSQNGLLASLIFSDQTQNQSSCFDIRNSQKLQMKDYTLCPMKKYETSPTFDFGPKIDEEESDWGFPRPCEGANDSNLGTQLSANHFLGGFENTSIQSEPECYQVDDIMGNRQPLKPTSSDLIQGQNKKKMKVSKEKKITKIKKAKKERKQKKSPMKRKLKTKPITKTPKARKHEAQIKKESKRQKNQTKNIVKNFGKQFLKFVHDHRQLVQKILPTFHPNLDYETFDNHLQEKKYSITRMDHLRELWSNEYGALMRVICQHFLRKHCFHYIFNSRIQDFKSVLKYRQRLQLILTKPNDQISLKFR